MALSLPPDQQKRMAGSGSRVVTEIQVQGKTPSTDDSVEMRAQHAAPLRVT